MMSFLQPDECLVYVKSQNSFADVDGVTHIAKIIRQFIDKDILWYKLLVDNETEMLVTEDYIVSKRQYHDLQPHSFYHHNSVSLEDIKRPVANNFVFKTNTLLESTRSGYGSGIYGKFKLIDDQTEQIFKIECMSPFIIQDKEHGESLTVASLKTNVYLDNIIELSRDNINDIDNLVKTNSISNLVLWWNIVFHRVGKLINRDQLEGILIAYIKDFVNKDISLYDSINSSPIIEQPINDIMIELGFDSLLGDDSYTNNIDQGCVSYVYDPENTLILGDKARYQVYKFNDNNVI